MAVSGRERVQAALRLEVADRPPVSAWGHTYDAEWAAEPLVAATLGLARRFGFDFIKLQVRMTCFAETFGARWRYSGSPAAEPVMEVAGGATAEDWRRIAVAGGLERHSPIRAEPAEMRNTADAALAGTGGRGHLLTLGCSVSPWPQARPENLAAMVEAAAALATA